MMVTKCGRIGLKAFAAILVGLGMLSCSPQAEAQCNPTAAQSVLQTNNSDSRYQALKYLEGCFTVPAGNATVPVIECDSAGHCGQSPKLFWTTETRLQPGHVSGGHGKPGARPDGENAGDTYDVLVGAIAVNAVDATLSFQRANTTGVWTIYVQSVKGSPVFRGTAVAAPGQSTASVSIGRARAVTISIPGPEGDPVEIHIVRLPVIGVGAFEFPVLPLSIIYGMPQVGNSSNTNSYTSATTVSTSLTASFSDATSTRQPVDVAFVPPMQNLLSTYKSGANLAGSILGSIPQTKPLGDALTKVAQAIPIIQGMLGSMSYEQTDGTTVQSSNSLTVSDTQALTDTTGVTGGPGLDDLFVFLRNVRVMWVVKDGQLQLTILSYVHGRTTGKWLLEHKDMPGSFDCVTLPGSATKECLNAEAVRNLLSLDPLTAGLVNVPYTAGQPIQLTPAMLAPPRFSSDSCQPNDLTGSDGSESTSFTHTVSQQDQSTTTAFRQTVTDAKAGWLSFAAASMEPYVVPTTQTTTTTMTNVASTSLSVGTAVTAKATININAQNSAWGFMSCYDSLFGTFAFVPLQISPTSASYSGQVAFMPGQSIAGRQVVLEIGPRRYVTFTDRQGRYAFHFPIARGAGVLALGSQRIPVQIR